MSGETPNFAAHDTLDPLASRYVKVASLDWQATGCQGVDWKILFQDRERGLMTALVRFQPGSELDLHRHLDIEQSYVLEGSLEDAEGACEAGDFVWRPIGNCHRAKSPKGALLIAIFQTPNVFLEGPLAGRALAP
jgi:anti-sigma factor ChrR (cupin superfamily)